MPLHVDPFDWASFLPLGVTVSFLRIHELLEEEKGTQITA